MTDDERLTKVARIALALQRAGEDHLGDTSSLHRDFIALLEHWKAIEAELAALRNPPMPAWRCNAPHPDGHHVCTMEKNHGGAKHGTREDDGRGDWDSIYWWVSPCPSCNGTGRDESKVMYECEACWGHGHVPDVLLPDAAPEAETGAGAPPGDSRRTEEK